MKDELVIWMVLGTWVCQFFKEKLKIMDEKHVWNRDKLLYRNM